MKRLIKNGFLVDKINNLNHKADILLEDEKIIKIGNIEESKEYQIIDAADCYVVPGLIDNHIHLYPFTKKGVPAETVCFSSGVTTAVDSGSCGCDTYEETRDFLKYAKLKIKSYINISSLGLSKLPELENLDPKFFNKEKIKELFEKYPEELIGLKIRISKNIVKENGLHSLEETVKIAEELSLPVMVHSTDPPEEIEKVLSYLRKGDILTHMYQNSPHSIINSEDKVDDSLFKAREKGIIFEASDAKAHFSIEVAEKAIRDGFLPDIIATDLTTFSMHQRPTAFNMAMQISKYENLGIKFIDIIQSCTETPAKILGLYDKLGALKEGYQADIAIFKKIEKENEFGDRPYDNDEIKTRMGNFVYDTMMTIKNGEIVYRSTVF